MNSNEVKKVTGDKDTDALLHDEQVNQHLREHEVILHSVGSVLNTKLAKLYPLMADGTVERSSEFNLEDADNDSDWYDNLSQVDFLYASRSKIRYSTIAPKDAVKIKRLLEECTELIDGSYLALTKGSLSAKRQVSLFIGRLKGVTGIE